MTLEEIAENHGLTPEGVDYALTQYQIVLCEITHGMLSKPSYDAHDIIRTAQERWCDTCDLKKREEETEALMIRARENIQNAPTIGGWININDRMPEKDKDVLVWLYGDYYIGRYNQDPDNLQMRWLFEDFNLYEDDMSYITHWMPLPEPPIEI